MPNSKKIAVGILGCGWLGAAAGKALNHNGYSVWGTTTQTSRMSVLRNDGIRPVLLKLGNRDDEQPGVIPDTDLMILSMSPAITWQERHHLSGIIHASNASTLLFCSSTSVYPSVNGTVTEDDAVYIKSGHSGIVMLSLEDHFRNLNLSTVIFRFAGLYGPGREPGRFLTSRTILDGPETPVNLVHQEDCVRAINRIAQKLPASGTYNICADDHPGRKEFYIKAAQMAGLEPPHFSNQSSDYKIIDNRKFKEEYQFEYKHPNPLHDMQ